MRGRAFRLPGDARDTLKANKPFSAVPVAKSLPLCPLGPAQTAQQTPTCARGKGRGATVPPTALGWGFWLNFCWDRLNQAQESREVWGNALAAGRMERRRRVRCCGGSLGAAFWAEMSGMGTSIPA